MTTARTDGRRAIAIWLFIVAALVFAMVVLGGVTRLTESGLSITEWKPATGWIPPLSEAQWQEEFDKYRASPEYRKINRGMALEDFKTIFAYEYAHRVLGRVIGLAFLVPFVVFLVRRQVDRALGWRLAGLFVLGGLQGVLGWYMVASGLVDRPSVSQYRLAAHLGLAFVIYGAILWIALGLVREPTYGAAEPRMDRLRRANGWLLGLIGLTVLAGAFVAGLDAGLIHNTFPLMGGRLVPADWNQLAPWWRNVFENDVAVQFNHRVLAVVTVVATLLVWAWSFRFPLSVRSRRHMNILALMALLQALLGIATLLAFVPVWLGALHQAGALLLVTASLVVIHGLRRLPHAAAEARP